MNYDVIVIGAGASGLVASICAARRGKKVLIIDRMAKAGKKIYATGNGKCNFTNTYYDYDCYRGTDTSIVDNVLGQFSYIETIDFFEQLGILAKNNNGYIYPYSGQASSIVEVMLYEIMKLGIQLNLEENVVDIESKNKESKKTYVVKTDKGEYKSDKVIMAMGGKASPKLGSDGSGLTIAKRLGFNIITPNKALVQLKCKGKSLKSIAGVRLNARVKMIIRESNSKSEYMNEGEIIFTDYGISGIPIMQLSRYASCAISDNKKVELELDFFPDIDYVELVSLIKNRIKHNANKNEYDLLVGMINNKLGNYIVKYYCNDNKKTFVKDVVAVLKKFKLDVVDTNSWDNAQVMAGGISTHQINHSTLESNIHKGLYIVGELMDIDGTCGGYNLQWAWATGYIAGNNV